VNSGDLSEWLEERAQIAFGGLKTHVAHKQIFHARPFLDNVPGWRDVSRHLAMCRTPKSAIQNRIKSSGDA
jgi:hypothetical protein